MNLETMRTRLYAKDNGNDNFDITVDETWQLLEEIERLTNKSTSLTRRLNELRDIEQLYSDIKIQLKQIQEELVVLDMENVELRGHVRRWGEYGGRHSSPENPEEPYMIDIQGKPYPDDVCESFDEE